MHEHDAVDLAVEHVLKPVLDEDGRRAGLMVDVINELHGALARRGVKVRQRLVEEHRAHVVDDDARDGHALLLPAGELGGRVAHVAGDADELRCGLYALFHLVLRDPLVLQREGDVLKHRHADELRVRVLQNGAHRVGDLKDALLAALAPVYAQ